jgi:dihydrofolate reductase
MAKLSLHLVMSVDGFIATEDGDAAPGAQWDQDLQQSYLDDFSSADGVIFGRKTYEAYYGHWSRVGTGELPASTELEQAWTRRMVAMNTFVISNTLQSEGDGVTVIGGDATAGIRELKQQHRGDLLLICGPELFARLTAAGLIDEYILYISPLALCRGIHLFRDIAEPISLRPEQNVPFASGMTLHRYLPEQRPSAPSSRS